MSDFKVGDLVTVSLESWQQAYLVEDRPPTSNSSARRIKPGDIGTVLSVSNSVMNESRYARVLFDDKIGYVNSKFLKKA